MNKETESPAAIAAELGDRLKQARLNADMTQAEVAKLAGLTRKVVLNAEKGQVKLEALVAIMLVLHLDEQLDKFLPRQTISPIQLAKLHGKRRQRASGQKSIDDKEIPEW